MTTVFSPATSVADFSPAELKIESVIEFQGLGAHQVFDVLGDPARITDWYLLAKQVHQHPSQPDNFQVEFTFFGRVDETILHWDPPHQYIYTARGKDFPIQDYIAEIRVETDETGAGRLIWSIHFDEIAGDEFKRLLPVMLPAVNRASMHRLAKLIGGTRVAINEYF